MNPFEYAHDLITKESYDEEIQDRKDYNKFLINRTLSYHNDVALIVNEINCYPDVSKKIHYDFLQGSVKKKKRIKKYWSKGKKYTNLEIIKEYYNYSNQKAISVLSVLTDKDIKNIKNKLFKGGSS